VPLDRQCLPIIEAALAEKYPYAKPTLEELVQLAYDSLQAHKGYALELPALLKNADGPDSREATASAGEASSATPSP